MGHTSRRRTLQVDDNMGYGVFPIYSETQCIQSQSQTSAIRFGKALGRLWSRSVKRSLLYADKRAGFV